MLNANQHDPISLRDDAPCEHAREDAHDGGDLVQ